MIFKSKFSYFFDSQWEFFRNLQNSRINIHIYITIPPPKIQSPFSGLHSIAQICNTSG